MKLGDGVTDWINLPYNYISGDYVLRAGDVMTGELTAPDYVLSALDADITATAVDVFVYDTSQDDDGGADGRSHAGSRTYGSDRGGRRPPRHRRSCRGRADQAREG